MKPVVVQKDKTMGCGASKGDAVDAVIADPPPKPSPSAPAQTKSQTKSGGKGAAAAKGHVDGPVPRGGMNGAALGPAEVIHQPSVKDQ